MGRDLRSAITVSVTLALAACSGPRVTRTITPAQIGSKYARITGYFATAKAAPGGRHEEGPPADLQHDIVLDEATLLTLSPSEACAALVIRTESAHDEPLEQRAPSCAVGDRGAPVVVDDEVVTVVDHGYQGMAPVVLVEGIAASQYLGMSITQPADQVFRVVERRARVCCGAGGRGPVVLALDNSRWEVADYDFSLTFAWTIQ